MSRREEQVFTFLAGATTVCAALVGTKKAADISATFRYSYSRVAITPRDGIYGHSTRMRVEQRSP
jgi:hypothetical protein